MKDKIIERIKNMDEKSLKIVFIYLYQSLAFDFTLDKLKSKMDGAFEYLDKFRDGFKGE